MKPLIKVIKSSIIQAEIRFMMDPQARYGLRKVQKLAHFGPKLRKIGKGKNFGLCLVFSSYSMSGEHLVGEILLALLGIDVRSPTKC